ncbi:MAG: YjbF family lipoprotein [Pseudorhodobacter sp.]|nr:YjbF family lipoprotein [Pseudorhodobacter sp.]
MRYLLLALAAVVTLSACGNDPNFKTYGGGTSPLLAAIKARIAPPAILGDPNDPAIRAGIVNFRAALEKQGQPLILASNASLKFGTLLAPFGGSNGVKTWSSTGYQTISLRDGMMVATRGFGQDLMSSVLPSTATIAAAQGTTTRRYSYLDGADKMQSIDFACQLAPAPPESIEIVTKPYATRKVTEACSGPKGSFKNEYWFDSGTNLRQSKQFLAPGLSNMLLQRVID